MSDNSNNDELRRAEMMRMNNEYMSATGANYQHLLPPQYFTQQMYYPYVNPYSHLTEGNLAIHGYGSDGRPKFRRSRTIFNPEQLDILEQHFEKYKYPDMKRRKTISEEIGLPEERIKIWFQNRRAKDKRQMEQQVKLQKLVHEAIGHGGAQEESNGENVAFPNPQEHEKMEQVHFDQEAKYSNQEQRNVQYVDGKESTLPGTRRETVEGNIQYVDGKESISILLGTRRETVESTSQCTSMETQDPQVAIQNIDHELLYKVATILSVSNDATQLITDWSQSPSKLQTNNLEEQLRHFAQHHHKVLTENANTQSLPHNELEKSQ